MTYEGGEEMKGLKKRRSVALAVAAMAVVVGLVAAAPAGATGKYSDATGDNGSAPDVTGVTVAGDKASGQVVFQISGKNLSSSDDYPTFLDIDSDANPLTGDLFDGGADYEFAVGASSYGFWHYNGSDWVDTSYSTVHIFGMSSGVMISVNKSEIGNTNDVNFSVSSADWPNKKFDSAPDNGMFNFSIDDGGPSILSITLATLPTTGPKAGKAFTVTPTGLALPPSGGPTTSPQPESYACSAILGTKTLVGSGTGGCTFKIAKKKTRGKTLKVTVTVQYEGTSKAFPYTFKVK
jgi:hypothetical protein